VGALHDQVPGGAGVNTILILIAAAYIAVGIIIGLLVFLADLYFSDLSVQPRKYRMYREEVQAGWPGYVILYPLLWPIIFKNGDANVVREFLGELWGGV
jgi:H+/Cl- antiporter ClcA